MYALPQLRLSAGLINHVSSAYYTGIHVRPQLAKVEGDLVTKSVPLQATPVEFSSPHVTASTVATRVPDLKLEA